MQMNFLAKIATAGMLAATAGCASVPVSKKVADWQDSRPYAEKIKAVRESGRRVQSRDVDLIFTMADFKKELPECSASIDAVLALGKTALSIVAEAGNSSSPLYAAAVESVDRKWAMYVGRDVETDAGGDIEKYLEGLDEEYRAAARKDWEAYQRIVKNVPSPEALERGRAVCERFMKIGENGTPELDVVGIERLPYTGKEADAEDYSAFLVYRDNTPEVQAQYDNALMARLRVLQAYLLAQMNDLLAAAQALASDPEVSKLNLLDIAKTIKGVTVGITCAFADPLAKIGSAIKGYSLAGDVDKLADATRKFEEDEARKARND